MDHSASIQAAIWDLGGVIVRTLDHGPRARWEKQLGLQPGQLEQIVFQSEAADLACVGRADVDDVWQAVMEELGVPQGQRKAIELDFWSGDRVDYQLIEYIRNLRPRLKTGLLSNAWIDLRHNLKDQWKIEDAFDHVTISAEVGVAKPDPRIYQLALEGLRVAPLQAVFIDDFKINLRTAQRIGLHTIQFQSPQQAMADLDRLVSPSS